MLDRFLCDMVSWRDMGLSFGHVAINAAPAEFRRHILADRIIEKLDKAGIPPCKLQVEVTEGVFLGRGAENAERTIRHLHDYGVTIARSEERRGGKECVSTSRSRRAPYHETKNKK